MLVYGSDSLSRQDLDSILSAIISAQIELAKFQAISQMVEEGHVDCECGGEECPVHYAVTQVVYDRNRRVGPDTPSSVEEYILQREGDIPSFADHEFLSILANESSEDAMEDLLPDPFSFVVRVIRFDRDWRKRKSAKGQPSPYSD